MGIMVCRPSYLLREPIPGEALRSPPRNSLPGSAYPRGRPWRVS